MANHASAPLAGIRILDFSHNLPGPYATAVLASMGAEVIKVEPPRGDAGRHIEPFFSLLNRGKQSVVLDLRDPASQAPLQALVRSADVLVEGFRPGVMARLGCDPETARTWNPSLVYCSISAYGQQGPRVAEPGHDLNAQALAGVCHLQRDPAGQPEGMGLPVADLSTSLTAVASICAALAQRERTGEGAVLDIAMTDAVVGWAQLWGVGVDLGAPVRKRLERSGRAGRLLKPAARRALLDLLDRRKLYALPHYGVFQTRDRRWLALGIVDEDHFWKALCGCLGLRRVGGLPLPARIALGPVLRRAVARRLRARTREDWLARLQEAGVPASPVNRPEEARQDPQFAARGMFDADGVARAPLPQSVHLEGKAPALGEHTEQVLSELLG